MSTAILCPLMVTSRLVLPRLVAVASGLLDVLALQNFICLFCVKSRRYITAPLELPSVIPSTLCGQPVKSMWMDRVGVWVW